MNPNSGHLWIRRSLWDPRPIRGRKGPCPKLPSAAPVYGFFYSMEPALANFNDFAKIHFNVHNNEFSDP